MTNGVLFTDKYIVNGVGFLDEVMSMDELETILYSGGIYKVRKQSLDEAVD